MTDFSHPIKLIVQVPCLNEEKTLPLVLETIPSKIYGIAEIETLIIDDGSTDATATVARAHGVRHIVRHTANQGLGRSFQDGVLAALEAGADIVVNTDGDNQYPSQAIAELVRPILEGRADIVIGDRQTATIAHFSWLKKRLQKIGTRVLNLVAHTDVPDAASGFRAYSRTALLRLNTVTRFSYCMETLIQAGNKGLAVTSVPITTNPKTRESRLFHSMWEHVYKSAAAIIRASIMYRPYLFFNSVAGLLALIGSLPFLRYLYFFINKSRPGSHLQSLLIGALLLIGAFLALALGVIAELIRINRSLQEDTLEIIKKNHLNLKA